MIYPSPKIFKKDYRLCKIKKRERNQYMLCNKKSQKRERRKSCKKGMKDRYGEPERGGGVNGSR
jgi:hypothetical protein